jgi:hypothetical protein
MKTIHVFTQIVLLSLIFGCSNTNKSAETASQKNKVNKATTVCKIDSNASNKHRMINLDSITVTDFIKLLPIEAVAPDRLYVIATIGQADSTWITQNDISELIKYIGSEQPARCVMRAISSHFPVGETSTLGGQVMNIIDAYRLNKPYPYFLCDCSKSDKKRQKEILDWWKR